MLNYVSYEVWLCDSETNASNSFVPIQIQAKFVECFPAYNRIMAEAKSYRVGWSQLGFVSNVTWLNAPWVWVWSIQNPNPGPLLCWNLFFLRSPVFYQYWLLTSSSRSLWNKFWLTFPENCECLNSSNNFTRGNFAVFRRWFACRMPP